MSTKSQQERSSSRHQVKLDIQIDKNQGQLPEREGSAALANHYGMCSHCQELLHGAVESIATEGGTRVGRDSFPGRDDRLTVFSSLLSPSSLTSEFPLLCLPTGTSSSESMPPRPSDVLVNYLHNNAGLCLRKSTPLTLRNPVNSDCSAAVT